VSARAAAFAAFLALAAAPLVLVAGCTQSLPPVRVLGAKVDAKHVATYNGLALRTGQIIVSESPDATSFLFVLIPKQFHPFTHAAILSIEDGEPWVYDASGELKSIPLEKSPLDNVVGTIYRRRLFEYAAPNLYAEIYDPPEGADPEKIAAFARQKYAEKVAFDAYFDFGDHSKLFCTEFVELAVRSAGGPANQLEPSSPNPSIVDGMTWLKVPPGVALPAALYADPKRYVGALGQFPSRTTAWSYFEAKGEIHRRFTMDQRLGFVLTLDGNGRIGVRKEVTDFAVAASHLFDGDPHPPEPGDPRIRASVRKLAAEMLGPFPGGDEPSVAPR
jgi:hypothetical protein